MVEYEAVAFIGGLAIGFFIGMQFMKMWLLSAGRMKDVVKEKLFEKHNREKLKKLGED